LLRSNATSRSLWALAGLQSPNLRSDEEGK
jgi:hypothetical protein